MATHTADKTRLTTLLGCAIDHIDVRIFNNVKDDRFHVYFNETGHAPLRVVTIERFENFISQKTWRRELYNRFGIILDYTPKEWREVRTLLLQLANDTRRDETPHA